MTRALGIHNETLALQLAQRSVRKFSRRPVTDEQLAALVAAAQSAATSSNLQPWSVVAVRDPERKARLATLANDQQFINEASLFFVWVADLGRARRLAERAGTPLDGADYLETTIIGFVDTALAAQNAVVAAESLGLGTVFVGAVRNHPEEIAAELALPRPPTHTFRRTTNDWRRTTRDSGCLATGVSAYWPGWPAHNRFRAGTGCAINSCDWACRPAELADRQRAASRRCGRQA
ncbi:MAG: hypothetical protein QOI01_4286 [Mycobacterium sp.]|nr:hypothetical protein [Mycobacterium sp.]